MPARAAGHGRLGVADRCPNRCVFNELLRCPRRHGTPGRLARLVHGRLGEETMKLRDPRPDRNRSLEPSHRQGGVAQRRGVPGKRTLAMV